MDITFWNVLTVHISPNDWDFLCKNRFLSDNPSLDEIQAEFVSGTGISPNKKHLWNEADARFTEYVQELREIQGMNINQIIMYHKTYFIYLIYIVRGKSFSLCVYPVTKIFQPLWNFLV